MLLHFCLAQTPGGQTYDRSSIEWHIRQNGSWDPVTRQPFEMSQLRPNIAMKEVGPGARNLFFLASHLYIELLRSGSGEDSRNQSSALNTLMFLSLFLAGYQEFPRAEPMGV